MVQIDCYRNRRFFKHLETMAQLHARLLWGTRLSSPFGTFGLLHDIPGCLRFFDVLLHLLVLGEFPNQKSHAFNIEIMNTLFQIQHISGVDLKRGPPCVFFENP